MNSLDRKGERRGKGVEEGRREGRSGREEREGEKRGGRGEKEGRGTGSESGILLLLFMFFQVAQ